MATRIHVFLIIHLVVLFFSLPLPLYCSLIVSPWNPGNTDKRSVSCAHCENAGGSTTRRLRIGKGLVVTNITNNKSSMDSLIIEMPMVPAFVRILSKTYRGGTTLSRFIQNLDPWNISSYSRFGNVWRPHRSQTLNYIFHFFLGWEHWVWVVAAKCLTNS